KRGLNTKIHMAVDAHGMPLRTIVTDGTTHDSRQAADLIDGFKAENLLADKAYDCNSIIEKSILQGINPVIPSKRNRKIQRDYDQDLYKIRHLVENAFLHLKQWRGIATRYLKNTKSFLAAVHIRCIIMWAKIS
ncbi:MAG: IS5 family transposase, partial [Alphaproteobacteria bacterium]|nr:IS5 family transposase [Alphaproteobacteria bacterium]